MEVISAERIALSFIYQLRRLLVGSEAGDI
jgi:hypothetical protein